MSIKHVTFDDSGTIAFGSLAANYQTVLSLSDDSDLVYLFNTTDVPVTMRVPSGTSTKEIRLPISATITLDCRSNSKRIAKGLIEVKCPASLPTSGEVTVIALR